MIIGVDASNIRAGGGVTHLSEVLKNCRPSDYGFERVIVWAGARTVSGLCDQLWIEKVYVPILDGLLPQRIWWQQFMLPKLLKRNNCALLFSPGGTLPKRVPVPTVTMSQNLLPFDNRAISTYFKTQVHKKLLPLFLRLLILRILQTISFEKSKGLIFLTNFAKQYVLEKVKGIKGKIAVIPHGINESFFQKPRPSLPITQYSIKYPFRLLYVSAIDAYKHQWNVAEAIGLLRHQGYPITIDFVGPCYFGMERLSKVMMKWDSEFEFMKYLGMIPYEELPSLYGVADGFIFASSCETFGQILLEAMASGLPIACSNRGPMPELLGAAGAYFDPQKPEEIANAIQSLIEDVSLREHCAWSAFKRAQQYSWKHCAQETFSFLAEVAQYKC